VRWWICGCWMMMPWVGIEKGSTGLQARRPRLGFNWNGDCEFAGEAILWWWRMWLVLGLMRHGFCRFEIGDWWVMGFSD
jgi:hypothetical protein